MALLAAACDDDDDDDHAAADDDDDDDNDNDNDDDNDNDNDNDNDDDDTGPTRAFYMAAAPYHYRFHPYSVQDGFDTTGFDGKVDLLSLHMDSFFGVPWTEFATGAPLPELWLAMMDEIKAMADDLGVEVFLSLTPLGGVRDTLAPSPGVDDGHLAQGEPPYPGCYNFDTGPTAGATRAAYLAYVRWMVDFFRPRFLAHAIEMNMYELSCPDDYASLIELLNAAYDQEKVIDPALPIFPTVTVEHLWGYGEEGECAVGDASCLEANLDLLTALKRDRLGLSFYAFGMRAWADEIPSDIFSGIAAASGDPVVIAETGEASHSVVMPWPELDSPCYEMIASSEAMQIDYLDFLLGEAEMLAADFVCWWSLRDYLIPEVYENCPCDAPGLWCEMYRQIFETGWLLPAWLGWGSMGIMDYEQTLKPAAAVWEGWFARDRAMATR